MNILIIGWYGTETIGDRGILAGILSLIQQKVSQKIEVQIGSLFPFFTERTLKEDVSFYQQYGSCNNDYSIIDSTSIKQLEIAIQKSDWVIMGGGPLMHISQLYIIEYAFKYARKKKKKTMIFGCGIGPMQKKRFFKPLKNILDDSDEIILRDTLSFNYLQSIYKKVDWDLQIGIDPAAQAALDFLTKYQPKETVADFVAINFRKFPILYGGEEKSRQINQALVNFLLEITQNFEIPIELIPMHYFHVGDDDREILTAMQFKCNSNKIKVQQVPLSLEDTFIKFKEAKFTVGMRFHSVLFQTLVNRKNYILDYTEKSIGKISGFVNMVDESNFYSSRYISLQSIGNEPLHFDWTSVDDTFSLNEVRIKDQLQVFLSMLDRHL